MAAKKPPKHKPAKQAVKVSRDRDAVLEDFRRVVGPLRGRNRDQTPKA